MLFIEHLDQPNSYLCFHVRSWGSSETLRDVKRIRSFISLEALRRAAREEVRDSVKNLPFPPERDNLIIAEIEKKFLSGGEKKLTGRSKTLFRYCFVEYKYEFDYWRRRRGGEISLVYAVSWNIPEEIAVRRGNVKRNLLLSTPISPPKDRAPPPPPPPSSSPSRW